MQDVNDLEVPLVAAVGVSGLLDILSIASVFVAISSGGSLTGAAWTVITAGLSMSGVATALLIDYNRACTEAYDSYWEVFARRS